MKQEFLNPQISRTNLDRFLHRRRILEAVTAQSRVLHGKLLDVGCGQMPYKELLTPPSGNVSEYIGLDLAGDTKYSKQARPDLVWDGQAIPLPDNSVDCAMATEVLEHCLEPLEVMSEIHRVIRPGGVLFFTVPFLWPLHDAPHDFFRYTPFALESLLKKGGFTKLELHALAGWDGALCQMIGLWVRRRPMPALLRRILSIVALPACSLLASRDKPPVNFYESQMLTGISGLAWKD